MVKKLCLILSVFLGAFTAFILKASSFKAILLFLCFLILYYFALIILYFIFIYIVSLFYDYKKEYKKQSKFAYKITILTMEFLLDLAHVKIKTSGLELLGDKKFMLVYNHTSNFDPIVQSYILKDYDLIHISKPENFKIPIAGRIIARDCFIPIDRENNRNALKSIVRTAKYLQSNTYCVGVAPEGTRNKKEPTQLLPFRAGCFNIALISKCPIVICEMHNLNKIHRNFPFKRTIVEMNILKVMNYEDYKGLNTFAISKIVKETLLNKMNLENNNTKESDEDELYSLQH